MTSGSPRRATEGSPSCPVSCTDISAHPRAAPMSSARAMRERVTTVGPPPGRASRHGRGGRAAGDRSEVRSLEPLVGMLVVTRRAILLLDGPEDAGGIAGDDRVV